MNRVGARIGDLALNPRDDGVKPMNSCSRLLRRRPDIRGQSLSNQPFGEKLRPHVPCHAVDFVRMCLRDGSAFGAQ